ncbi:MAG: ORF6N domain-containing protein [Gemmobacter sp.]
MTEQVTTALVQARIFSLPNRPPFMIVYDLAEFYQVTPHRVMEQVRRYIARFPKDFIFEFTAAEMASLIAQNARPNRVNRGVLTGFTKEGALQLSSVLTGPVADAVSVTVIRAFSELERQAMTATSSLLLKLRTEEASRKRVRIQCVEGIRHGLTFEGIRRMGNHSGPQVALALRECLALGLIDRLPKGMPMTQPGLFEAR